MWKTKVCKRAGGRDKEQSVYTKRSASSFGNFHTWYTIMAENVWEILSGWVAAVWHRSAVNVFATFCFVGFVLQRHANKKNTLCNRNWARLNWGMERGRWETEWILGAFSISAVWHMQLPPPKSLNFSRLILFFYSRRLQHYIESRFVSQSAALGRHSAAWFVQFYVGLFALW